MITAIVLYDLPDAIGLEECRQHFTRIAPDFLKAPGFVRKQFICRKEGDPRIQYFETVALADMATGKAGAI
jgi:hypothetical protein